MGKLVMTEKAVADGAVVPGKPFRPTHYVWRNVAGSVFVKEAEFFVEQGGHAEKWGREWLPVTVDGDPISVESIERARKVGVEIYESFDHDAANEN